jgi:AraC-like DNA-binding protein
MPHLTRAAAPHLRPFVSQLWASAPEGRPAERAGAREHALPTGAVHLVFRLSGPPIRLFEGTRDAPGQTFGFAVVGGVRERFYVRDVSVATRSVGALLRPGAARVLLGAPEDALAGRHTPLDALWGVPATNEALERLCAEDARARQLDMLEALLTRRAAAGLRNGCPGLHPAVAAALAHLGQVDGPPVAALVAASGYSHRAFIALFRGQTGLTPKAYARLMRFDRVLALATVDPACGWADIALAAGYSDQPHLGREFTALAGLPPQAWRRVASPESPRHVPR